ncbi:hypothetical protein LOCC1_G000418 [Lachnellula occidentalis]|uniref:Uncharacterized protein n=1 Tax=Lachnellula occidentalis TaxID=215460 RepID=A0A8H8UIM4_9HELO|nr:hypothetical protein LOCC1_G000418 [Lachnellula occidentalis]
MASSSSTLSREEISAGAFGGPESLIPTSKAALLPQLSSFLSLVPTTSASYPSSPRSKLPLPTTTLAPAPAPENAGAETSPTILEVLDVKIRRSSSSGSDESVPESPTQGRRFLKLGPVHFGKDGDGKGDWSEEVFAE